MEGLNLTDVIIHIVNVLVLFYLLRLILFKPVNKFLIARSDRIAGELKEADEARAEARKIKSEYDKQLKSFEEDGRQIIRKSQIKANEEAAAIIQEAKDSADNLVAEARAKIANEKALAMSEARSEIALLATDIAGRILKREITITDNKIIAEDFFHEEQP